MRQIDHVRLRKQVVDQLESLQLAGVMQLPRVAARGVLSSPVEVGEEADGGAEVATVSVQEVEMPRKQPKEIVEQVVAKERPAETKSAPAVAKKPVATAATASGWQPVKSTTLFEPPAVAGGNSKNESLPTLELLKEKVAACTRCNELASTRTQTVFGAGNPKARLCFLGEAPGADEDKTGVPFVGRGGQLLTKIIEACRLTRDDVYILNMLKCRPPGNRNPLPHELGNCRGYLENQLDLIRPEFICCLGAVASQNLLGTTVAIGKLRGKVHDFRGTKVVCTYHPAFLLRSPSFKKETWEDMKMLMREMGMAVPE